MFSYECDAWIIAEANWTPFILKNNGQSGSFYLLSQQLSMSQRGPCPGCTVLLGRLTLSRDVFFLSVCLKPLAKEEGTCRHPLHHRGALTKTWLPLFLHAWTAALCREKSPLRCRVLQGRDLEGGDCWHFSLGNDIWDQWKNPSWS